MAVLCVNCGAEVTNDTAGGIAPACDECRYVWRDKALAAAVTLLKAAGYTVIPPTSGNVVLTKGVAELIRLAEIPPKGGAEGNG